MNRKKVLLMSAVCMLFAFSSCLKNEYFYGNSGHQKSSGKYDGDPTFFLKSAIDINISNPAEKYVILPLQQGWTFDGKKTYLSLLTD